MLSTLSPLPPSPTQKIFTHVYINPEIQFIYLQMHNEAQKQAYYPFLKIFKIHTIMDKSLWDSSERNFNSMRSTSSVAKSSAVFSEIHVPSPPPHPIQC